MFTERRYRRFFIEQRDRFVKQRFERHDFIADARRLCIRDAEQQGSLDRSRRQRQAMAQDAGARRITDFAALNGIACPIEQRMEGDIMQRPMRHDDQTPLADSRFNFAEQ